MILDFGIFIILILGLHVVVGHLPGIPCRSMQVQLWQATSPGQTATECELSSGPLHLHAKFELQHLCSQSGALQTDVKPDLRLAVPVTHCCSALQVQEGICELLSMTQGSSVSSSAVCHCDNCAAAFDSSERHRAYLLCCDILSAR